MSGLNDSIETLLELRDEAERAFSDPLGEDGVYMYDVRVKKEEKVEKTLLSSDCHNCPLWENRKGVSFYFNPKKARVISVVAFPEVCETILAPDAQEMYEKQMSAISIARSERALLSLLKCPADSLDRDNADKCRHFLKEEMVSLSPDVMILFGLDVAHYILGNNKSYEEIRAKKKSFKVNGIKTYVTYSQRECIDNPSFKRLVWDDLQAIRTAIS